MQITEYWRSNQLWSKNLGKKGKVIAVSMMDVAATDQVSLLPYSYLLIELEDSRISVMGAAHESFKVGDEVELVLRKIKKEATQDIITYGLKAKHV